MKPWCAFGAVGPRFPGPPGGAGWPRVSSSYQFFHASRPWGFRRVSRWPYSFLSMAMPRTPAPTPTKVQTSMRSFLPKTSEKGRPLKRVMIRGTNGGRTLNPKALAKSKKELERARRQLLKEASQNQKVSSPRTLIRGRTSARARRPPGADRRWRSVATAWESRW